jgi:hypothetical protein
MQYSAIPYVASELHLLDVFSVVLRSHLALVIVNKVPYVVVVNAFAPYIRGCTCSIQL